MGLTAEKILATGPRDAKTLVTADPKELPRALKKLAGTWHPDLCDDPQASDVFAHLIKLADQVKDGPEKAPAGRILRTKAGRELQIRPLRSHAVDWGEILVSAHSLMSIYAADQVDLAEREVGIEEQFLFRDDKMRRHFAPLLPQVARDIELEDGRRLVAVKRHRDLILLADLLASEGPLPAKHAAWLCTRLLNLVVYLETLGLVHGAISTETILINPELHTAHLAAGWGFATKAGARPLALPGRTLDLQPRLDIPGQTVNAGVDLELVRQTVREALGDPRGTNGAVNALPLTVASWLRLPPAATALADLNAWETARDTGWGERRFLTYPVTAEAIYGRAA